MTTCEICQNDIGNEEYILDANGGYWHQKCLSTALARMSNNKDRDAKLIGGPITLSVQKSISKYHPQISITLRPPLTVQNIVGYRDGGTCAFDLVDSEGLTIGYSIDPRGSLYVGASHHNNEPFYGKRKLNLDHELVETTINFLENWLPAVGSSSDSPAEAYLRPALQRLRHAKG